MLTGLISLMSGGLTGLLGAGLQKFFDYKSKKLDIELNKQKFDQEVALRKIDLEVMSQEWAARTKVAEVEANAVIESADAKAFGESFSLEPKLYSEKVQPTANQSWLLVALDVLRGIVRPALTLYLAALTTLIYIQAANLLNGDTILPGMAYELTKNIVDQVLYLTMTAVSWYFGIRNGKKGK